MHVSAIVLAAGKGLRFKSRISKPLVFIGSNPIIYYCLHVLNCHPLIKDITVVINKNNRESVEKLIKKYKFFKINKVVVGGKLRQDSVLNGLKALGKKGDLVLIHDSARPFITKEIVTRVVRAARISRAAIAAIPLKPTVKRVILPVRQAGRSSCLSGRQVIRVKETLKRDELWEAQTPQVFKKDLLFKAYKKFSHIPVTDDASLVERLGIKPSLAMGSYLNIKITTPEDLVFAEAALKALRIKK